MIIRNVLQSTQLCFLKRAFAEVNKEFGLDANVADDIMKAADEVQNIGLTPQPLRGTHI